VVAVRTEQARRVFTVRHFSGAAAFASIARSARFLASRRENAETLVASPRSADLLRAVLATAINPLIRRLGLHNSGYVRFWFLLISFFSHLSADFSEQRNVALANKRRFSFPPIDSIQPRSMKLQ